MKIDTPHTFVLITVGVLPPDVLPEAAGDRLIAAFTTNLTLIPYLRGTTIQLSGVEPLQLLKALCDAVPAAPVVPRLSLDRDH